MIQCKMPPRNPSHVTLNEIRENFVRAQIYDMVHARFEALIQFYYGLKSDR